MQDSDIPVKFNIPWGNSAGVSFIRNVPQASQIGLQDGAASLTDGFPPLCFSPVASGGVPPFGEDFNGIFKQVTQWLRWLSAGALNPFDSAYSAAIGGYPKGVIVASATTFGLFYFNNVDNNASNPDTGGANWTGVQLTQTVPAMQGKFSYVSGTSCTFSPSNGGLLWINGLNYLIPSGGVNFTNGSVSASTLYYAYARMAGGTMTGELSTTGYSLSSNGIPQKIGDATRTLVGMLYTTGGTQFVSQDGNLQVLSWSQRALKRTRTQFSADRTTTSAAFVELNSEIRNSFLVWANENLDFATTGSFQCAANQSAASQISFDGAAGEQESCALSNNSGTNRGPLAIKGTKVGLSEGLHFATLLGARDAGTATWHSSNTNATAQCTIIISLQG